MSPFFKKNLIKLAMIPLTSAVLVATGCTSGMVSSATTQSGASGPAFVVGTDAPMASVVSFKVTINSITATNTSNQTVSLLNSATTVDFARFNGLQTLLDMNDVAPGTYTSVTIAFAPGSGTIGYLATGSGAPTIATMPATFTNASPSVTLSSPLVVGGTGTTPAGLRIDFELAQSIQTTNGAINGMVSPTLDIRPVKNSDPGGYIDEFTAGVISVDQATQSFVIQGPHGEDFTVDVNGSTEWDGTASLSELASCTSTCIVQVSGTIDPADQTLDADEVAVISDKGFFASGQVTYVTEVSGSATSFQMYVRGLEPTSTGLTLGQLATVNLSNDPSYYIYWAHNPLTEFLFNPSSLVAGQDVVVGGPASGATNASDVSVDRIHLRNWGFNGTITGTPNPSQGTFTMTINGFAGVLVPQTVTVYLGTDSDFRYGLGSFSNLTAGTNVRVVGLLLYDSSNGQTVLLARHIDGTSFTNFAVAAWQ